MSTKPKKLPNRTRAETLKTLYGSVRRTINTIDPRTKVVVPSTDKHKHRRKVRVDPNDYDD